MARIDYADPEQQDLAKLADQIVPERGELLHLYQILLHSPPVARGWLDLMTAVRKETTLPGALREMIIIRIANLNGATYEAEQHAPIALREGASEDQIMALAGWRDAAHLFDSIERAVLELTDQMTEKVRVNSQCWNAVKAHWSERQIVELVATISSYNMVSRFLVALEISSADDRLPSNRS